MRTLAFVLPLLLSVPVLTQSAEKRVIVTITAAELKGGVISEIAWDRGTIVLQGVFVNPDGTLAAQYFVTPADQVRLEQRTEHTMESAQYWESKARTLSPTGIGRITTTTDTKLPMYGIASQAQRMSDAVDMGGTQKLHVVRLNKLTLYERTSDAVPYAGEVWSWSPAELNRITYVDKGGDLWVAGADGSRPQRLLKGNFTLPAWSDDGRLIAVAEQKNGGKNWQISIVHVPVQHRQ
ncbi:MAG TPA: hypothetical protein VNJ03_01805 [Vicinamibacterales bacterium]|nr:hypothetical protein [Vicinamibacterales bacterium]